MTISAALVGAVLAVVIGNSFASRNQESSPPLLARVEALENLLQQQQAKREELEGLVASLPRPQAQGVAASVMAERLQRLEQEREGEAEELDETEPALITPQFSSQARVTREQARQQVLIAGGFSEEEANWVSELESQVELDRLFEQHRWQRDALAENAPGTRAWLQRSSQGNQLREKIGDDYYARYLKANGFPAAAEKR